MEKLEIDLLFRWVSRWWIQIQTSCHSETHRKRKNAFIFFPQVLLKYATDEPSGPTSNECLVFVHPIGTPSMNLHSLMVFFAIHHTSIGSKSVVTQDNNTLNSTSRKKIVNRLSEVPSDHQNQNHPEIWYFHYTFSAPNLFPNEYLEQEKWHFFSLTKRLKHEVKKVKLHFQWVDDYDSYFLLGHSGKKDTLQWSHF